MQALVYMYPGCIACERAIAVLGAHGYDVDTRNISDPVHLGELHDFGYSMAPIVVIEESQRSFPGWPDEVLYAELGIPFDPHPLAEVQDELEATARAMRVVARLAKALPDALWDVHLVERDRPLSQWVWHIFRMAEVFMDVDRDGPITLETWLPMAERSHWTDADRMPTFGHIATYGEGVADRLQQWAALVTAEELERSTETLWGTLSMAGLVSHLLRHTTVHLGQIVEVARSEAPAALTPELERQIGRLPTFAAAATS